MRKIYALALLLMFTSMLQAGPITLKQAQRKALQFAAERHPLNTTAIREALTVPSGGDDGGVYVLNVGQRQGFVVIDGSGDILGYSDKGEFDASRMPDNLRAWLNHCARMSSLKENSETTNVTTRRKLRAEAHPQEVVDPLLTTQWAQSPYYNAQCPYINDLQCVTGCTATAMAQVLRYHRYPKSVDALPSYTTRTSGIVVPALPATTFDWDLMPDMVDSTTTQASVDEVAKLMRYCGQSVDMNYMKTGSGAYTYHIPSRLPLYFGYANSIHYESREAYSASEWDSLLVRELVNKRPVIYTAYTNISQGHTFVCDGYDGKGYFHINWGWNGDGNGYYLISDAFAQGENLNHVSNYHLSMLQTAVIGIKPEGDDDFVPRQEMVRAYSRPSIRGGRTYYRAIPTADFSGISIRQACAMTGETVSPKYGFGLYDDSGALVWSIEAGYNKPFIVVTNAKMGAGLPVGHYTLKAIYHIDPEYPDWRPLAGTDENFVDVQIADKSLTLTPIPHADFNVETLEMNNNYLHFTFYNPNEAFFGPIYLRRLNANTGVIEQISTDNLTCDAKSNHAFDLYIAPDKSFDLEADCFYLSADEFDNQYFYTNAAADTIELDKEVTFLNLTTDKTTIVGDRIMGSASIANNTDNDYSGTIAVYLIDDKGHQVELSREKVTLAAGASLIKDIELPLTDFSSSYGIKIAQSINNWSWLYSSSPLMPVAEGAIYWTKSGAVKTKKAAAKFKVPSDALAIILTNAFTSSVTANSNPNTIYILGETVPKTLASKNHVDASLHGTTLTLTDGFDYFIPREMTFSGKVSYERPLSTQDSIAWATIALPFTAEAATVGSDTLAYRNGEEGDEGALWLVRMTDVSDTIAITSYSDTLRAHTPYLLGYDQRLWDKTISFVADGCTLSPTEQTPSSTKAGCYTLTGSFSKESVKKSYALEGRQWVFHEDATEVAPFRAYLTCDSIGSPALIALDIDNHVDETTPDPIDPVIMGDVNDDGAVNVVDAMMVVQYILSGEVEGFNASAADLNQSGTIDVTDVMMIVNIILGIERSEEPS